MRVRSLEQLLTIAEASPITASAVERVWRASSVPELHRGLVMAAARDLGKASTLLAFALARSGMRIEPALMAELVPVFWTLEHMLCACSVHHIRSLALLRVIGERNPAFRSERVAALIAFAVDGHKSAGRTVPGWLVEGLQRSCAALCKSPRRTALLGWSALQLGLDAEQVGGAVLVAGASALADAQLHRVRSWAAADLSALGTDAEGAGPAPAKVRRNDPCPCGSGKKFKRCCARHDSFRRGEKLPVRRTLRPERMQRAELRKLTLTGLDTDTLLAVLDRTAGLGLWEEAGRVLRQLSDRPLEGGLDPVRADLVRRALEDGATAWAENQVKRLSSDAALDGVTRIRLALRGSGALLTALEACARAALDDEDLEDPADVALARALLAEAPALGVLIARAALEPHRPFVSEALLDELERTRQRLGLKARDRGRDWLVAADDDRFRRFDAEHARNEQLGAEARTLRSRLAELEDSRSALARKVRLQERALARQASQEAEEEEAERDDAEVARLRGKIATLRGLLGANIAQRRALRAEVKRLREAPSPAPDVPAPESSSPLPSEPAGPGDGRVRLPRFTRRGADALRRTGAPAQAALQVIAGLAGGASAGWSEVKRLKGADGLHAARVGLHYRLLFYRGEDELEVVDLVTRQNLLTAIKRLR